VKEGRGKPNGPKPVSAPAQHRRVPNRYAAKPSRPADMWDPHVRVTIYLWAEPLSLTACPGAFRSPPPLNPSPSYKMRPPINSPRHPPSSPFASPQVRRKAVAESLAELHGICELARPNSPPPVNLAPPSPSHLSCFPLVLLPDLFSSSCLQRNTAIDHGWRSPAPTPSSSRPLSLLLETIDNGDHTSEIPSPCWLPSWHRRHLEAVVALSELNQSRALPKNTSET
jgi:hypothetical protein